MLASLVGQGGAGEVTQSGGGMNYGIELWKGAGNRGAHGREGGEFPKGVGAKLGKASNAIPRS